MRLQRDVEQLINQNPQAFPQTAARSHDATLLSCGLRCSLRPAAGADAGGRCRARGRARRRALRRLSRRCGAGLGGGAQPGRDDQHPAPLALQQSCGAARASARRTSGITAGCQLLARVGVGEAYMWTDGVWRRRAAGQAAPVPDYCR